MKIKRSLFAFFNQNQYYFLFLILLLGITFILPYSGAGVRVQQTWKDQSEYLNALNQALEGKLPIKVESGWLGPGYIALGVIFTKLLGTQPEITLVLINKIFFLLTILVFFTLSFLLTKKAFFTQENLEETKFNFYSGLISFVYTLIIVFSCNFTLFSDIPWTHFIATPLILICFLCLFLLLEIKKNKQGFIKKIIYCSVLGFSFGLLIQIRFFEALVLALSFITWFILSFIFGVNKKVRNNFFTQIFYIILLSFPCFVIAFFTSLSFSNANIHHFHFLYFTQAKDDPFLTEVIKIYPLDFFLKFIQLFIDTNFFNINHEYNIVSIFQSSSFTSSWRMPLLLQVPCLLFIFPFSLISILLHLSFLKKNKSKFFTPSFFIPLMLGSGLIIGYVCVAFTGSPKLKYGFVRDFMASTWSLALVAGPWVFYPWLKKIFNIIYYKYHPKNNIQIIIKTLVKKFLEKIEYIFLIQLLLAFIISIFYGSFLIFWINFLFKINIFLEFPSFHIENMISNANCHNFICNFEFKLYNSLGDKINIPKGYYVVDVPCKLGVLPKEKSRFTKTIFSETGNFDVSIFECSEHNYLIKVFPASIGVFTKKNEKDSPFFIFNPKTQRIFNINKFTFVLEEYINQDILLYHDLGIKTSGFYLKDNWTNGNGKIVIPLDKNNISENDIPKYLKLSLTQGYPNENTPILITINDHLILSEVIETYPSIIKINLDDNKIIQDILSEGKIILNISSLTWIPKEFNISADTRKLGVKVKEIKFMDGEFPSYLDQELVTKLVEEIDISGFYPQESNDFSDFRWTDGNTKISIPINQNYKPKFLNIDFEVGNPQGSKVQIFANDVKIFDQKMIKGKYSKTISINDIDIKDNLTLDLLSNTWIPKETISTSEDSRKLGIIVRSLKLNN